MKILGIETSCDDTGVAVLEIRNQKIEIRSNVVSSQVKLHAKYGGVYPFLAKREHQKNLPIVLKQALKRARILEKGFDLIAITVGPGLEPCLWVGVNFAKDLAKKLKVPIVPVDHMEGHILANFIGETKSYKLNAKSFPAIALAVSGGHTQLILMKGIGKYKLIGETRDDAAGECFDKTARILGLGYPGGPAIAAQAAKLNAKSYKLKANLPRPMMYQKNYDFSFSGLKTAVLYHHQNQPPKIRKSKKYIQVMAGEIQQAIIDVLIHKTIKAAQEYKAKTIMLGGGVASNEELRNQLKAKSCKLNADFLVPPKNLCTDNGAMIAAAGYFKWLRSKKKRWQNIGADANLKLQ